MQTIIFIFTSLVILLILHKSGRIIDEHFNRRGKQESPEEIRTFTCPTLPSLTKIPPSCPTQPLHPNIYNSSLFPIYRPDHPGPSTQTNGFRHVLLAALQLKKSVIFGNFTKHRNDGLSEIASIPFGLRVDLGEVCKLVRVFGQDDKQISSNAISSPVIALYSTERDMLTNNKHITKYLEEFTNFNFSAVKLLHTKSKRFNFYPHSSYKSLNHYFSIQNLAFDHPKIIPIGPMHNLLYNDFYKLIDYGGAYTQGGDAVLAESKSPNFTKIEAIRDLNTDLDLVRQVFRYTPHPGFVKDLVGEFLESRKIDEENFISIHFRFNYNDFFGGPKHMLEVKNSIKNGNFTMSHMKGVKIEMIEKILKILDDPSLFLEKLLDRKNFQKIQKIFIFSPQNTAKLFANSASNLTKISTSQETFNFLKQKSKNCQILKNYFGDILSTFEKEIALQSKCFYRARPSNWSFNVQGQRWASGKDLGCDGVIYDIINDFS